MLARKLAEPEEEEEYAYPQAEPQPARIADPAERAKQEYLRKQQAMLAAVQKKRLRGKIAAMLLAFMAIIGFLIYQNSMIAARGYEIVQVRMQAVKLEAENAQLKITNAHLKSPQRIRDIATSQLGMSIADHVYFADPQ